jgi:MFS transporter, YNFM family, putative membrane transport protein
MGGLLLGAAGMFATLYSPQAILPEIERDFGIRPVVAGLTVSAVVGAIALGALLWGAVSDRLGRKRSILLACSLLVIPTAGAAVAPSFELLVAARVLQGVCIAGLLVASVPYIGEVFIPRIGGRAMGYYVAATVAGSLVGRVGVGLVTAVAGWRWGLAGLALAPAAAAVAMRGAPADAPGGGGDPGGRAATDPFGDRALVPATVGGAALFFTFVGTSTFVSFRLAAEPFGYGTAGISLLYVVWVLGGVGPLAGRVADRFGWQRLLLAALLAAMAGVALSLPDALPAVVAGLGLLTVAMFSGVTAAQLGVASATARSGGRASGVYFTSYYVAGGLGAFAPGFAWEAWGWTGVTAVALAVLATAATVSCVLAARPLGKNI